MDELLLASSRHSPSGEEGDLEQFLATKPSLKEQIEQWNKQPSNPKFYVTLQAPNKSSQEFELNLTADNLIDYLTDLLGGQTAPEDDKEIEVD